MPQRSGIGSREANSSPDKKRGRGYFNWATVSAAGMIRCMRGEMCVGKNFNALRTQSRAARCVRQAAVSSLGVIGWFQEPSLVGVPFAFTVLQGLVAVSWGRPDAWKRVMVYEVGRTCRCK